MLFFCYLVKKMDQFFEWHDNDVLCQYYRQLLEQNLGIPSNYPTEFDEKWDARVHVDSNMQKTSQLLKVSIIDKNCVLGMQCSKIGAKSTMNFQPIDLGKIFKFIKSKTRSITIQGKDYPLIKKMTTGLDKLQRG